MTTVLIKDLKFPESPFFDNDGCLWFVELSEGCLSKWVNEKIQRYYIQGTPNGATLGPDKKIWICDSSNGMIKTFDPITEKLEIKCIETNLRKPLLRPNDLIFDKFGNLIFSDHADGRNEPLSTICVLPVGENQAKVISTSKYFTNGLALIDEGSTLVFSETYRQNVWKADWNPKNLLLTNEQIFFKAGKGPWGPDGMTTDGSENLYVTIFNESQIRIFNKNGIEIGLLTTDGSRPTSCCFDPRNKFGLVVTEAERGEISSYSLTYSNSQ